jgi:hypothetical protein
VLPLEDSRRVPSTLHLPRRGAPPPALTWAHLRGDVMVLPREAVLATGGFAEAHPMDTSLELVHRWETSGRRTRILHDLVVWRQPWRDERQLARLAVQQAQARGAFYGALLRNGDRGAAAAAIAGEYRAGLRSVLGAARHRRPGWSDPRRGILRGLALGIVRGMKGRRTTRSV